MLGTRRSALVCALAASHRGRFDRGARRAAPPLTGPMPTCSGPCFSIGDASVIEGDSATRTIVFPVTLSQPSSTPVSVQYRVVGGTAFGSNKHTAGIDFNNQKSVIKTLSFPVGANGLTATAKTLSVAVWGDTTSEPDETFRVLLSNPSVGTSLARRRRSARSSTTTARARGRISGSATRRWSKATAAAAAHLSFPITLSSPAAGAFTLNYSITSTDATWALKAVPGADYGGKTTGTLSFPLGAHGTPVLKRVTVPVWPDTNLETPDETITLTVSSTSLPAGVTITRPSGTGTIVDDDATPTTEPVPNSMAALGDSISRGFDACPAFGECVASNWSTGTDPAVDSQYERILAVNPNIAGHAFNDAVSGATESNLVAQANNAVSQQVDYITIEMGGNDACKATEAQMTPVATYQSSSRPR